MRLLVVEDEQKVARFVRQGLTEEGYAGDVAADGETGLAMALDRVHDLIILDIQLPRIDGLLHPYGDRWDCQRQGPGSGCRTV